MTPREIYSKISEGLYATREDMVEDLTIMIVEETDCYEEIAEEIIRIAFKHKESKEDTVVLIVDILGLMTDMMM